MLLRNRVDAIVINELVGRWVIKNNSGLHNSFATTSNEVELVGLRIMFSKKWAPFIEIFNKDLEVLKQNGRLERIIEKYQ